MKTLKEVTSCLNVFVRIALTIGGFYIIYVAGYDRILEDPLYALVVIIFLFVVFSYEGEVSTDDDG